MVHIHRQGDSKQKPQDNPEAYLNDTVKYEGTGSHFYRHHPETPRRQRFADPQDPLAITPPYFSMPGHIERATSDQLIITRLEDHQTLQ